MYLLRGYVICYLSFCSERVDIFGWEGMDFCERGRERTCSGLYMNGLSFGTFLPTLEGGTLHTLGEGRS